MPSSASRIFDPAAERLEPEKRRTLQLERLQTQLRRLYDGSHYYGEKMRAVGVRPQDIRGLEDLARLPFTEKEDLRRQYPYGAMTVPLADVVRLQASTGTTGRPIMVGYTRTDLEIWTQTVARILVAGGLSCDDIVQIAFGYGLFTGGFGLHQGAERVGATVIPVSSGNSERQVALMRDLGVTALVCTPSYALCLAEELERQGITKSDLRLRLGFFGGEFWSEIMRKQIQSRLGLLATDNYGLSEVMGPGVSGECLRQDGMHIAEDHFLCEVVDPETGDSLPDEAEGELVFTTLTRQASPVIRYRTRDRSRILTEPCPCGRTTRRMAKVTGRADDMLIIRGVNVFPSQVETVLLAFSEIRPHYELVVSRDGAMDQLEVRVEADGGLFSDRMGEMAALRDRLQRRLDSVLGLRVRLTLLEPGSLERVPGKARRVRDLRVW